MINSVGSVSNNFLASLTDKQRKAPLEAISRDYAESLLRLYKNIEEE